MFESIQTDDAAARFRAAAIPPVVAVSVALLYLTIYRLLPRVPAPLFWSIVAILLMGTVFGAIAIVRAVRRGRPRGTAIGWLAGAIAIDFSCAWLLLSFTFPWL